MKIRGILLLTLVLCCILMAQKAPPNPNGQPWRPWPQLRRGGNGLVPRYVPPKPDWITIDPTRSIAGLFVLKFVEGTHIRMLDGKFRFDSADINTVNGELYRLTRAGLRLDMMSSQIAAVNGIFAHYREAHGFQAAFLFRGPGNSYVTDDQFVEKAMLEQRGA